MTQLRTCNQSDFNSYVMWTDHFVVSSLGMTSLSDEYIVEIGHKI